MQKERSVLAWGIQKDWMAGSRYSLHILFNMTLSPLNPISADSSPTLTMTNITEPALQTAVLGIPVIPLVTDIFFGILGLIVILVFHGTFLNHVIMKFDRGTKKNFSKGEYRLVYVSFYATFIFIALIHIGEIVLWTFYLFALGLMKDGVQALVFVGSCYTTVGFASDSLPAGWKSLAFFIAFTGLFSIAWTTSVMIGMTDVYKQAWNQRHSQDDSESS